MQIKDNNLIYFNTFIGEYQLNLIEMIRKGEGEYFAE